MSSSNASKPNINSTANSAIINPAAVPSPSTPEVTNSDHSHPAANSTAPAPAPAPSTEVDDENSTVSEALIEIVNNMNDIIGLCTIIPILMYSLIMVINLSLSDSENKIVTKMVQIANQSIRSSYNYVNGGDMSGGGIIENNPDYKQLIDEYEVRPIFTNALLFIKMLLQSLVKACREGVPSNKNKSSNLFSSAFGGLEEPMYLHIIQNLVDILFDKLIKVQQLSVEVQHQLCTEPSITIDETTYETIKQIAQSGIEKTIKMFNNLDDVIQESNTEGNEVKDIVHTLVSNVAIQSGDSPTLDLGELINIQVGKFNLQQLIQWISKKYNDSEKINLIPSSQNSLLILTALISMNVSMINYLAIVIDSSVNDISN